MAHINKRKKKIWDILNYSLLGPKFSKNLKLNRLELRLTQVKIVNFILRNFNVGIVFATSLGKTIIDILLIDSIWLLDKMLKKEKSRFLILVPTIDLANQFAEDLIFFRKFKKDEIAILANINAKKRQMLFTSGARIFISTPQGIKNDFLQEKISPNFFQYLILDEAHYGRGRYAYTTIAEKLQSYTKILAQTATAGDEKKRQEIAKTLNLQGWWRPRIEEELSWLNPILREEIFLPLNEEKNSIWLEIEKDILNIYQLFLKKLKNLFEKHFTNAANLDKNGKKILEIFKHKQILSFTEEEKIKNYILNQRKSNWQKKAISYWSSLRQTREILARIFQEGYRSALIYYDLLKDKDSYSSRRVWQNLKVVIAKLKWMQSQRIIHPKLEAIIEILKKHPSEQVIMFLNHVQPLQALSNSLKYLGFPNSILVGKANKHLQSEKEAEEVITKFRQGKIKILLVSPVGFEGRHFPHINVGIAVNMFISPEQLMQAMGRLGRTKINDVMYFLIFGRYDRAMYYSNLKKIKKLFSGIPTIPEEYTPLDPNLETSNLPIKKNDFWAKDLIKEKRQMIRERFLITETKLYKPYIYFALKDKTGFANAILYIDVNADTNKELINFYLSLKGKICIVSGKLKIEKFFSSESEILTATINITPYPDRQNIAPAPYNSYDLDDYK